jgi:hypothetical protein
VDSRFRGNDVKDLQPCRGLVEAGDAALYGCLAHGVGYLQVYVGVEGVWD